MSLIKPVPLAIQFVVAAFAGSFTIPGLGFCPPLTFWVLAAGVFACANAAWLAPDCAGFLATAVLALLVATFFRFADVPFFAVSCEDFESRPFWLNSNAGFGTERSPGGIRVSKAVGFTACAGVAALPATGVIATTFSGRCTSGFTMI
jgi:hypothetical protein